MGHVSRFRLLLIMLALAFCASLLTGQSVIIQAQDATPTAQNSSAEAESTEGAEATTIPRETANHAAYEILQQDFETAPDVTRACLTCHNQADEQLHATAHWNWEFEHPETGQLLGKRHIIDNNVLSITENQAYCATCHTGYGYDGPDFDFSADTAIDCLSCHDTTGTYEKLPGNAGHPAYEETEYPPGSGNIWEPPDLSYIAQNVGSTSRQSCGSCHFGERDVNPFIHGHLPAELADPSRELDVHMGTDYLDFSCTSCHEPQQHDYFANTYRPVTMTGQRDSHLVHTTCINCHDQDDLRPYIVKANQIEIISFD